MWATGGQLFFSQHDPMIIVFVGLCALAIAHDGGPKPLRCYWKRRIRGSAKFNLTRTDALLVCSSSGTGFTSNFHESPSEDGVRFVINKYSTYTTIDHARGLPNFCVLASERVMC